MSTGRHESETIGVVGLGYVGLPLSLAFADAGYDVVGVDVDEERVRTVRSGRSYITDVSDEHVAEHVGDRLTVTTEYDALASVAGISICVPTPLRDTGQPDISYIIDATERLSSIVEPGCTVVLESTVYPSATREVVAGIFEEDGKRVGEDIFVAFSPERIDPGNDQYGPEDIPKIIGGITSECGDRAVALYQPVFNEIVRVDSATEAEMAKLLENTFRSVNIALINEMATIAHELNVNIWNAIDAAATKPFGFMPFYPGPGLGGHCIPIDPLYLTWKAEQHGIDTQFINLAANINRKMPEYVVGRVMMLLNDVEVSLKGSDVLVVGAAYKENVSDLRESPALDIIAELEDFGADVEYHDPYIPELAVETRHYRSVPLTPERLEDADCVIIVTAHDQIDIERIVDTASLIFDTRNATADFTDRTSVHRL